jgi:2-polyprenyl-3-methyl-5-hydroxy-6-metoxy-1,4-benzoquinol methylase
MLIQERKQCPVCGGSSQIWCKTQDWEYSTSSTIYTYLKCQSCQSVFIKSVPETKLSDIYPPQYYSFTQIGNSWIFRIKNAIESSFFTSISKKLKSNNISVLDIGGGSGDLLTVLKKKDKRIIYSEVVDINEAAGKLAVLNGHAFTLSTIECYQSNRKFELIFLLNLIEHVSNPLLVLQKTESLLSPGGMVILKTPNTDSIDATIFRTNYWGGLHCPRHWVLFNAKSLQLLLTKTSFSVLTLKYTQGAPFWAYSIIHLLSKNNIHRKSKPLIEHPLFSAISLIFAIVDKCRSFFAKTSQMFIVLTRQ